MYERFFGFSQRPFALLPDSGSIFWAEGHRNAFSVLEVGLDRLSQITVLTGGIGTGKTTLIRHLLQTASTGYSVGLLSNLAGDRGDLLRWVLSAFALNIAGSSEAIMYRRLENFVCGELEAGRRAVLVVDEAQNLSERDLESLRLLGNLNAEQVLMMLVLAGQPQLRAKMARIENQRLRQRIGADYHLEPLSRDETARYVRHRCVRAGGPPGIFRAAATDEIFRISDGVPRKINVLCDLALATAYAEGASSVDYRIVRSVMDDARQRGTYMSLTEHDAAVVETQLAAGAENQLVIPAPAMTASRDPMQRPAPARESGGGGLAAPRGARAGSRSAPASHHPAPRRAASPAPLDQSAVNALFDMSWSDDTLHFVDEPADEQAGPVHSARHSAASFGDAFLEDDRSETADPVDAARPGNPPPSAAGRELFKLRRPQADGHRMAERASGSRDAMPAPGVGTVAGTVAGTELALRRAFARPVGWRGVGWRGGAAAAFAVSGSLAAGMVLALLPDGPLPADAESRGAEAAVAESVRDDAWARFLPVAPAGEGFEPERPTAMLATPFALQEPDARGGSALASDVPTARAAPARPRAPVPQDRPGPLILSGLVHAAEAERAPIARAVPQTVEADADPQVVFRAALDVGVEDARAAVIGYARAALLGHERAAYYLGQIYETGDGVPVDFAIARYWYEAASDRNPRARHGLAALPSPERGGAMAPPIALLAQPLGAGRADFVWTSGDGADPASYLIEISADPRSGVAAAHAVTGSAARLPLIRGASHWRVRALDASGSRGAVSDWRPLSADGPDRSAAVQASGGHL